MLAGAAVVFTAAYIASLLLRTLRNLIKPSSKPGRQRPDQKNNKSSSAVVDASTTPIKAKERGASLKALNKQNAAAKKGAPKQAKTHHELFVKMLKVPTGWCACGMLMCACLPISRACRLQNNAGRML